MNLLKGKQCGWLSFFYAAIIIMTGGLTHNATGQDFSVSGNLSEGSDEKKQIEVRITIPDKHYIYADKVEVAAEGAELTALNIPEPMEKQDPHMGKTLGVYTQDVEFVYSVLGLVKLPLNLTVKYQGCSDTICFMPASESLTLGITGPSKNEVPAQEKELEPDRKQADWRALVENFAIGGSSTGYMPPDEFTGFLDSAMKQESGDGWTFKV